MATDPQAQKTAREFIDSALAERSRLGYTMKVSKKSYGRAVDQAAGVFDTLRRTSANGNGGLAPVEQRRA